MVGRNEYADTAGGIYNRAVYRKTDDVIVFDERLEWDGADERNNFGRTLGRSTRNVYGPSVFNENGADYRRNTERRK